MRTLPKLVVGVAVWTPIVLVLANVAGFWRVAEADDPGFTFLSEVMIAVVIWLFGTLVTAGVLVLRK